MWKRRPREGRWLAQSHLVTSTGSITVLHSHVASKFHPQSRLLSRTSDSDITVLPAQPPKCAPGARHTGPELPCRTLALLRARTLSRAPLPQCRLQKPEARSSSLSLPPPESLVGYLQVLSPWAPSTTLAAVTPAKPTAASLTSWMLPSHSLHCGQGRGFQISL